MRCLPAGPEVAVLGGGFMGMTVAYRLAQAGCAVTLYEAGPSPGGVSASFSLGDFTVDRFYHTVLPGDTELMRLMDELGLAGQVSWRATRTGFYKSGRLHSVSTVPEFLRFPVLTLPERLRLGWTLFRAQHGTRCESIRHMTCEEWLSRSCGRSVFEKLWRPLLDAKLGAAAPRVSASFIWATMNRLQDAKSGDSLRRSDKMGFIRGGYQVVLTRLVEELRALGVAIETGAAVTRLRLEGGDRWRVETASGGAGYRAVVATLPFPITRRLLGESEGLDHSSGTDRDAPAGTASDASIEYLGVLLEVLLLREPLSPFYVLNLGEDDLTITGIIETTNLAPPDTFRGMGLIYLPRYLLAQDPLWRAGDAEVSERFRSDLRRVFPQFDDAQVVASAIQRAPFVQPVHTVDYAERIPPVRIAPGFWVASSAQVYPWPLNNDRIVRQAQHVVDDLLGFVGSSSAAPGARRFAHAGGVR